MSLLQSMKIQFMRLSDKSFQRHLQGQGSEGYRSLILIAISLGLLLCFQFGRVSSADACIGFAVIILGYSLSSRASILSLSSLNFVILSSFLYCSKNAISDLETQFIALAWATGSVLHGFKLSQLYQNFILEQDLKEQENRYSELKEDADLIVDHLPNGIYLFKSSDIEGNIDIESLHSPLFAEDLGSRDAENSLDLIWKASGHKLEDIHAWKELLASSIGDTILQWDFNAKSLPKELRVGLERGTRIITAEWEAIRSEDGIVQKIILLLNDVTELRLMYEDSRARSEDAKRLMELISNSPRKMGEFFALAETVLTEGKSAMIEGAENLTLNFRNIHTLKGMARGYQLSELSACLGTLEESLQSQALTNSLSLQHLPSFQASEISLRNYKNLFQKAYTRQISGNQVTVDPKVVLDLSNQIETAYVRSDIETAFNALNEIRAIFATTLDKIIIDEISMLRKLAEDLDKPHPNLYINELDIQLSETGKITLRKVFVHLFRNSIDHGIESEDVRERKGKANRGQISIHTAKFKDGYRITYKDDGQGLSLAKVHKKALELGIADASRSYSPKEIADLIFQSGLSTASQSSSISGRGVGMDAIRSFLRQENGNISIELDDERDGGLYGFSFVIDIPMKKESIESMPLKKAV